MLIKMAPVDILDILNIARMTPAPQYLQDSCNQSTFARYHLFRARYNCVPVLFV